MIDVDQLFIKISAREENIGWDALSSAERTIATAMLLWYEVGNGGFHQYFFNTTGDLSLKAPGAFRAIGAIETADVVEKANELFGSEGPNVNQLKRQAQLGAFTDFHLNKLDELDKFIFDDPEDIENLISMFALRNGLKE